MPTLDFSQVRKALRKTLNESQSNKNVDGFVRQGGSSFRRELLFASTQKPNTHDNS